MIKSSDIEPFEIHPCGDCANYGDCEDDPQKCKSALTIKEMQEILKDWYKKKNK